MQSSPSTLLKMVESRISPHAGQEQLQHFRFYIKLNDDLKELDEFYKKNGMEYNRQSCVNLDLVLLWRFGSGFGDPASTFDNVHL